MSVRLARYQLAQALLADGDSDDALDQMRRVLEDHGTDPRDSTVYATLSTMHEARGDLASALEVSVLAVARTPTGVNDVRRALRLIERLPGAAGDLSEEAIRLLEARIRSAPKVRSAWLLAGQLRLQRGEYNTALEHFRRAPKDRSNLTLMRIAEVNLALGRAEEARKLLLKAAGKTRRRSHDETRFRLLLSRAEAESGHYREALGSLPDGRTPEHSFVRALVFLGQGRLTKAFRACARQLSVDASLLRALVHLRAAKFEEARAEALAAASQNPSSPDVLLVRAQVELESAENLEEGRGLLERAFETSGQNLAKSRWPALQRPFAHDRETFQYFLAEAADASDDPEALSLAQAVDKATTKHSQDGRLDMIRGKWSRLQGQATPASEAFEEASRNFEFANLLPAALSAARLAFEMAQSGSSAAQLSKVLWRTTFLEVPTEERLGYLAEATKILDTDTFPGEGNKDADRLVYFAGLVAVRKAGLAERDRQPTGWDAATKLMAAILNSDRDPYRARFLAEALGTVGATGAAVAFANRAFEWGADDTTREAAVAARANHYRGVSHIQKLLDDGFENPQTYATWGDAVRCSMMIDSGEHPGLSWFDSQTLYDGAWVRFAVAKSVALLEGIEKASPLFQKVAEELSDSRGDEHTAALAWLHAGQPQKAQRCLDEGRERQNVPSRFTAWVQALTHLASGESQDVSVAMRCVEHLPPIQVGEVLYATIPILRKVYPREPFVAALASVAERVEGMVTSPIEDPTVCGGLDDAPERLRPLLGAMANLIGIEERGADVTEALRLLQNLRPGGRLQRVLDYASRRLLGAADREGLPTP